MATCGREGTHRCVATNKHNGVIVCRIQPSSSSMLAHLPYTHGRRHILKVDTCGEGAGGGGGEGGMQGGYEVREHT